jgi:hypothetical protein
MKSLIWDIETTDIELLVRTYGLKNFTKYFSPDLIQRDWSMLGAAWMPLEGKRPTIVSVSHTDPFNDEDVVKKTHEALQDVDLLIGHNSDKFDYKKFNTRALYYGLPPVAPKLSVDTLKVARKYFAFTSNKLGYMARYLGIEAKDESPDWEKIMNGDKKELNYMRKYNGQDVIVTKEVYLKLRSFHHTHPNMNNPKVKNVIGEDIAVCGLCQSPNLVKVRSKPLTSGRLRHQHQCKDCYKYTTSDLVKA